MSSASRYRADKSSTSCFVADGSSNSRYLARNGSSSRVVCYGGSASRWSPDELDAAALMSALSNLSANLTINGVTKTPTFDYQGKDCTTSAWVATVGQDLAVSGSGADVTPDQETPTLEPTDRAVLFDASGKRMDYSGATSYGQLGTDDAVFEAVLWTPRVAVGYRRVLSTYLGTGYLLSAHSNGFIRLALIGAGGSASADSVSGGLTAYAYNHVMGFCDASGSVQLYIQGIASGSPASMASVGNIINGRTLSISDSAGQFDGCIAKLTMWQGAGWLDSHLQPTVAAARAKALEGANTDETRDCPAYLHKPVSGTKTLVLVDNNWMRLSQEVGESPEYQKETAETNKMIFSDDLTGASWSTVNASIAATSVVGPDLIPRTTSMIHEDATASVSHRANATTYGLTGGNTYRISLYAKEYNRRYLTIRLYASGGGTLNVDPLFDLNDGGVEALNGAEAAGSEQLNGWFRLYVDFTAPPTATSVGIYLFVQDSDSARYTNTFNGLDQDSLALVHVNVTEGHGWSSPIDTDGATATRLADA